MFSPYKSRKSYIFKTVRGVCVCVCIFLSIYFRKFNTQVIIIDKNVASLTQTAQYTLTTINRCYDHKTFTCQASNPAYWLTDRCFHHINQEKVTFSKPSGGCAFVFVYSCQYISENSTRRHYAFNYSCLLWSYVSEAILTNHFRK
jgi:hypothetical protein